MSQNRVNNDLNTLDICLYSYLFIFTTSGLLICKLESGPRSLVWGSGLWDFGVWLFCVRLEILGNPESLEIKTRFLHQSIPIIRKWCKFTANHERKHRKHSMCTQCIYWKNKGTLESLRKIATVVPTSDCGADKHMLLVNLIQISFPSRIWTSRQ